jgi:hypothetical protein
MHALYIASLRLRAWSAAFFLYALPSDFGCYLLHRGFWYV